MSRTVILKSRTKPNERAGPRGDNGEGTERDKRSTDRREGHWEKTRENPMNHNNVEKSEGKRNKK